MNSIFYELTESVFVHINAASLSVMDVALDNGWVGAGFHLKSSNSVIMNVILLEIALHTN